LVNKNGVVKESGSTGCAIEKLRERSETLEIFLEYWKRIGFEKLIELLGRDKESEHYR